MQIPFYNFHDLHHQSFQQEINHRIADIIKKGAFIDGEYNFQFEKEFAELQGAKHCLLVANGTDALEISLLAYGIRPGDNVGVPGITFYATAEAVLNIGANPIMVDVTPEDGLICPESFKRMALAHNLKAVMPVHIYGLPAPVDQIEEFCLQHDIKIIEDAAQAQGTLLNGEPIGSRNNLVTFSFYPTKNLSAFGDAGCILTQDDELAEKIKVIRNHGRGDDNVLGRNSRCDHIQAAVLQLKLKEIEGLNQARKKVAQKYHEALGHTPLQLLDQKFITSSSWHLYPAQCENEDIRQQLQDHLQNAGIASTNFYATPLTYEGPLRSCPGEEEGTKKRAGKTICLPIHPFLKDDEIQYIAQKINEFFA